MGLDLLDFHAASCRAFVGYNRGLIVFSEVVGCQGSHPSRGALVLELNLLSELIPLLVERGALLLFSYLHWCLPAASLTGAFLRHLSL